MCLTKNKLYGEKRYSFGNLCSKNDRDTYFLQRAVRRQSCVSRHFEKFQYSRQILSIFNLIPSLLGHRSVTYSRHRWRICICRLPEKIKSRTLTTAEIRWVDWNFEAWNPWRRTGECCVVAGFNPTPTISLKNITSEFFLCSSLYKSFQNDFYLQYFRETLLYVPDKHNLSLQKLTCRNWNLLVFQQGFFTNNRWFINNLSLNESLITRSWLTVLLSCDVHWCQVTLTRNNKIRWPFLRCAECTKRREFRLPVHQLRVHALTLTKLTLSQQQLKFCPWSFSRVCIYIFFICVWNMWPIGGPGATVLN